MVKERQRFNGEQELATSSARRRILHEFRHPESVHAWYSIDDVVMGGVSRSQLSAEAGFARFSGELRLEQGGGFASIRTRYAPVDLGTHQAIVLRARGDGKSYKLSLREDGAFDGVSHQATFPTQPGAFRDYVVPLAALAPMHHGREVRGARPLDARRIGSFGLLIADRQEGRFQLDIAWIGSEPELASADPAQRSGASA